MYEIKKTERVENALTDIGIGAVVYGVFFIVLPNVKRFTDEKIYPFLSEKWDKLHRSKKGVLIYDKDIQL